MNIASRKSPSAGYVDSRFFRARLIGLCVACPYHHGNPAHCQFRHARELPLGERYRWISSLSLIDLAEMIAAHEECLRTTERTGGLPPHRQPHRPIPPLHEMAESA